jgi:glycosyltransferase involved in cell wall biosynthesis
MQGGVGDFTREVGLALTRLGATVSVISSARASQSSGLAPSPDVETIIERDGLCLTLFPVIEHWGLSSWSRIVEILNHSKPQVLNIQYQAAAYQMHPAVNFLPWRLRWLDDRPGVVTTFHDFRLPYLFPKAGPVRHWVTRALIRGSEATVVTNVEDQVVAQSYGARNLNLIPIGSNIDPQALPGYDRQKWRERGRVGSEDTLLCYFGFLNESKGAETLFRAVAQLVDSGHRVKLLMIGGRVGSSDPANVAYLQKMEAVIEELGLKAHISWTEYVDGPEVSANFWASDICVLPYRDGVSFRRGTLMAALAHGLPILSTYPRVKIAEITEGENMALVRPDDSEALAGRIAQLAASPSLRQRLARGAAELSKLFSWEAIAERTMRVYEKLLDERK